LNGIFQESLYQIPVLFHSLLGYEVLSTAALVYGDKDRELKFGIWVNML